MTTLTNASGTGSKELVVKERAYPTDWSRDGREIFYLAPDTMLVTVDVETRGDSLAMSAP